MNETLRSNEAPKSILSTRVSSVRARHVGTLLILLVMLLLAAVIYSLSFSRLDRAVDSLQADLGQAEVTEEQQAASLAEIRTAWYDVRKISIIWGLLIASTAFIATFINLRGIVRPVERLTETAARLAAGHLEERVSVEWADEFGRLADSFNEMADRIQITYTKLEQRVAQRTVDLKRRADQLEAAATVARESAAFRDLGQLLEETVHLISGQFDFYHAGIFLLDEAGEYAVLEAASSEGGRRMLARRHQLKVGEVGIVGYASGEGEPRIALDVGEDAVFFDNPDLPDTRSEMALPLKVRGRVIGVLDVQSMESAAFTDDDVSILQTMADQISLAIENARLLVETEERVHEISALLRRESREGWKRAVEERQDWGYVYDGVEAMPKESAHPLGMESQLTAPLQVRGESIGRLNLTWADRSPTSEEMDLVRVVADQAGQALESARLFRETQSALGETETLYRAGQVIVAASTPDDVLRAFTDYVVLPQIERCVLALLDPVSLSEEPIVEIKAAWEPGVEQSPVLGNRWSVSQIPLIAQMIVEPIVISDVANSSEIDDVSRRVFLEVLGIDAVLIAPLLAGGQIMGWLLVESLEGAYEFSEREVRLYRTLADQAAVALEGMRLLEETRQRGERERLTHEITNKMRRAAGVEGIVQVAVDELFDVLGTSRAFVRLEAAPSAQKDDDVSYIGRFPGKQS